MPPVDPKVQQAAQKIQAAARRKQLFQRAIHAADFNLISGFIADADGNAAAILQDVVPGAKGVVLFDFERARLFLKDVAAQSFELLGVLVLGNECPCKKSCGGRLSFPALSKTGNGQVLLSGCFHNVGRAVLKPDLKPTPEVALTEAVHCSFQLHLDEWSDGGQFVLLPRFSSRVAMLKPSHSHGRACFGRGRRHPRRPYVTWCNLVPRSTAAALPLCCNPAGTTAST